MFFESNVSGYRTVFTCVGSIVIDEGYKKYQGVFKEEEEQKNANSEDNEESKIPSNPQRYALTVVKRLKN